MNNARDSKGKIFYGWWIVLASAIAWALSGGFYLYGFSTFFIPLTNEFGWSRVAISGAFSMSRLEGGLLGPAGGFLVDKFGPRKMMLIGITIMGAGFILLSRMDSLLAFYLTFILCVAAGATLSIHQATLVAIANWFKKKRGTAMGFGVSGVGLGGLLVPILGWLIVQYGWRPAFVITGLVVWAIGIPLALVMRHRPEEYGYLPDGEIRRISITQEEPEIKKQIEPTSTASAEERISPTDANYTPRQALRTGIFWLLTLIFALRQFVVHGIVIHQIPFLTELGISFELAATMLGAIAIISIVGRLGFGRMADTIEKKYVMAICLALLTISCFILVNAQTLWHIVLFLIVYSPAYGGGMVVMNAIRAEYFGPQYFGTIRGFMNLAQVLGTGLGPVFAGWIFDMTGQYRLAFLSFTVVAAVATILMLVVRPPLLTAKAIQR